MSRCPGQSSLRAPEPQAPSLLLLGQHPVPASEGPLLALLGRTPPSRLPSESSSEGACPAPGLLAALSGAGAHSPDLPPCLGKQVSSGVTHGTHTAGGFSGSVGCVVGYQRYPDPNPWGLGLSPSMAKEASQVSLRTLSWGDLAGHQHEAHEGGRGTVSGEGGGTEADPKRLPSGLADGGRAMG